MSAPDKYDWHRIPKGFKDCPVCGLKHRANLTSEHRAIKDDENLNGRWMRRSRNQKYGGWRFTIYGIKERKKPTPKTKKKPKAKPKHNEQLRDIFKTPIPAPETIKFLRDAATLYVQGIGKREIEKQLGYCESYFRKAVDTYSAYWRRFLSESMDDSISKVRADAGTDAVLADPDKHMERARRAEKWLESKGEKLFSSGGELTLTRFYLERYNPQFLFEASCRTKEYYITALNLWRYLTGDPPIEQITALLLCKFRDALLKSHGKRGLKKSVNTVRGRLRVIQTLLDRCGPPGRGNREAVGLIKEVPYVRPPRYDEKMPRIVAEEQIAACYEAAVAMDVPWSEGIKPPAWWRSILALSWNTGLRTGTILSIRVNEVDWKNHRLVLPSRRMKSKRPLIVHLNETVMEHLQRIRGGERELLFPWPAVHGGKSRDHTNAMFYRWFKKLQKIAGIPDDQHFGLHTIRKTLATRLWEISPGIAQAVCGHTGQAVTQKHYVNSVGIASRALDALPQPNVFIMGSKQ